MVAASAWPARASVAAMACSSSNTDRGLSGGWGEGVGQVGRVAAAAAGTVMGGGGIVGTTREMARLVREGRRCRFAEMPSAERPNAWEACEQGTCCAWWSWPCCSEVVDVALLATALCRLNCPLPEDDASSKKPCSSGRVLVVSWASMAVRLAPCAAAAAASVGEGEVVS